MRRDLTVRIDVELRAQAAELGINISRFLELELEAEIARIMYERELVRVAEEQATLLTDQLRREGVLNQDQHVAFDLELL